MSSSMIDQQGPSPLLELESLKLQVHLLERERLQAIEELRLANVAQSETLREKRELIRENEALKARLTRAGIRARYIYRQTLRTQLGFAYLLSDDLAETAPWDAPE